MTNILAIRRRHTLGEIKDFASMAKKYSKPLLLSS